MDCSNPIQAVVLLFQWWFAVAPAVCLPVAFALGEAEDVAMYTRPPQAMLLVVAVGLLLYGVTSRHVLRHWPSEWHLRFVTPQTDSESLLWIAAVAAVGGFATLFLLVMKRQGVDAFEVVNIFGGTQTLSPSLATVAALGRAIDLALVALLSRSVAAHGDPRRSDI